MEPGEELSLVQNTDANGGGGGAFFTDYTIKVGYFEE
jgi:hypothetical protein